MTGQLGHPSSSLPAVGGAEVAHPYFRRSAPAPGRDLEAKVEWGIRTPALPVPSSEAAKAGLRFERKVTQALQAQYPSRFVPQLQLNFRGQDGRASRAILDGLLLSPDAQGVLVAEIKLRHSGDAFWQLERFYKPIVSSAFRGFVVSVCAITRYYDPAVKLPKPVAFVDSLEEACSVRECYFPVLIYSMR